MSAVDQHKRAYDDHCPLCGEGVTLDDHEVIDEINMWCGVAGGTFDVAVLLPFS
jgi:ribosomal protein S27AE